MKVCFLLQNSLVRIPETLSQRSICGSQLNPIAIQLNTFVLNRVVEGKGFRFFRFNIDPLLGLEFEQIKPFPG